MTATGGGDPPRQLFGVPEMREFAASHDDERVKLMMRRIEQSLSNAAKWCNAAIKLEQELARLRDATRPRRLTDELPPEDMHEALFWDGVRWEVFDNWEGDSWMAEWINSRLMSHTHWLSLPEPPKEGVS